MIPRRSSRPYLVEIANQQQRLPIRQRRWQEAVRQVLAGEGIEFATISVAIVNDATIHELNRKYLQHDYPTDVLSFVLEADEQHLEGEVVVSAETAERVAGEIGWPAESELLLYLLHGLLHLTGYDDHSPGDSAAMRDREQHYLQLLGVELPALRAIR